MPNAQKPFPLSLCRLDLPNRACGTRGAHQISHPFRFSREDPRTKLRKPIVTATRVVRFRVRSFFRFFDESVLKQAIDRSVQRSGSEANGAHASFSNGSHYRVAVSLAIGKGEQDMEDGG